MENTLYLARFIWLRNHWLQQFYITKKGKIPTSDVGSNDGIFGKYLFQ